MFYCVKSHGGAWDLQPLWVSTLHLVHMSLCILCPAVDLFHFQSRQLRRLVLHMLVVYAVSGVLFVTDMIASAVYWGIQIQNRCQVS